MLSSMAAIFGAVFLLVLLFIVWLKYREHLHLHRHENSPHSDRTDLRHKPDRRRS
jgi:hypothetical protein